MKRFRLDPILAVLLLAFGCSASPPSVDGTEAIMALEREWSDRFQAKDVAWVAAHHWSDAQQFPPGAPAVVGGEAIRGAWQTMVDTEGLSLKWEPSFAKVSGDLAYDVGKGTHTSPDGVTRQVKYVVVWERRDGEWKIAADIFNFDD